MSLTWKVQISELGKSGGRQAVGPDGQDQTNDRVNGSPGRVTIGASRIESRRGGLARGVGRLVSAHPDGVATTTTATAMATGVRDRRSLMGGTYGRSRQRS